MVGVVGEGGGCWGLDSGGGGWSVAVHVEDLIMDLGISGRRAEFGAFVVGD